MALSKGSRVFLVDKSNGSRRYGTIVADDDSTGRYSICLDNLQFVNEIPSESLQETRKETERERKAPVCDGALADCSVIGKLFPILRRLAEQRNETVTGEPSSACFSEDYEAAGKLNQQILAHWDIYMYRALYTLAPRLFSESEQAVLTPALRSLRALRSWGLGFQANLWFVGRDHEGTYAVPEENKYAVYKIVSFSQPATELKSPGEPMSLNVVPVCMKTTIVPWFGRLLYDSTAIPPKDAIVRAPNPVVARYLQTLVLKAIKTGVVIDTFFELEKLPTPLAS